MIYLGGMVAYKNEYSTIRLRKFGDSEKSFLEIRNSPKSDQKFDHSD